MAGKPEDLEKGKKEIPALGLEEEDAQIEALIEKRLAETDQARHEEARRLAEQFARRALQEKTAKQDGGGSGMQPDVTASLLSLCDPQYKVQQLRFRPQRLVRNYG